MNDRTPWRVRWLVGIIAFAFAAAAIPIWLSDAMPIWAKALMGGLGPYAAVGYFSQLMFRTPTYRTVFKPAERIVHFEENLPHKKIARSVAFRQVRDVEVAESRDSDGDPYFTLLLDLADGRRVPLNEGHEGEWSHAARDALMAMLKPR